MARRRLSVREQIERTLPSNVEDSWYKKPGERLSHSAIKRKRDAVFSRIPRKGETTTIHRHVRNSLVPSPKDMIRFIHEGSLDIHTMAIACVKGKKVIGYTVIRPGDGIQIEKMYNYMVKLKAEGTPKTNKEWKNLSRRIKSALTRYGFNVRIIAMPGFAPETNWKKRRKKRVKKE